ncbi:hypothetical protein V8E36_002783 [Tilletia maclaganii]
MLIANALMLTPCGLRPLRAVADALMRYDVNHSQSAPEGASAEQLEAVARRPPTHDETKAAALAVFEPQADLPHWEDSFPPPPPEQRARQQKFGLIPEDSKN